MPLNIRLSSTLRKYVPGYDPAKGVDLSLDKGTTVAAVCMHMNIPAEKVKIIMINGKSESLDYQLKGNERIGLFPPVGGG